MFDIVSGRRRDEHPNYEPARGAASARRAASRLESGDGPIAGAWPGC